MLDSGIKAGEPKVINSMASKESLLTKRNSGDLEVVNDGIQRQGSSVTLGQAGPSQVYGNAERESRHSNYQSMNF